MHVFYLLARCMSYILGANIVTFFAICSKCQKYQFSRPNRVYLYFSFLVMACFLLTFFSFYFLYKRQWNFNHPLFYTYPPPLLHRNDISMLDDVQDLDDTSRITQFTLKPDFYPYFNFEERDFYFEDF